MHVTKTCMECSLPPTRRFDSPSSRNNTSTHLECDKAPSQTESWDTTYEPVHN